MASCMDHEGVLPQQCASDSKAVGLGWGAFGRGSGASWLVAEVPCIPYCHRATAQNPWKTDSPVKNPPTRVSHGFQVVRNGFCPTTVGGMEVDCRAFASPGSGKPSGKEVQSETCAPSTVPMPAGLWLSDLKGAWQCAVSQICRAAMYAGQI